MAINLGDIEEENKKKKKDRTIDSNQMDVGGLILNRPSTLPKPDISNNKKENKWLNKGAYKDGYQKGDFLKTATGSVLDLTGNITQGILERTEKLSDWIVRRAANVADWTGADNTASKWRNYAARNDAQEAVSAWNHILAGDLSGSKTDEEIGNFQKVNDNSIFGSTFDNAAQGIGSSLTGAVLTYLSGGAGTMAGLSTLGQKLVSYGILGGSAAGGAESEALASGASEGDARRYSYLAGINEIIGEEAFGKVGVVAKKMGLSTGYADKLFKNRILNGIDNVLLKNVVNYGLSSIEEGGEEVLTDGLNAIAKKLTYMSDEDIGKILEDQNMADSFIVGTLSSLMMGAPSTIVANTKGIDAKTGLNQAQTNAVNSEIKNRVNKAESNGNVLNSGEVSKIKDQTLNDFYEGKITMGNDYLNNRDSGTKTEQNSITKNESNVYQFEKSDNEKVNAMKESASKYYNNSEQTKNYIDTVEKVIKDTDYSVVFDDSIGQKGKTVNGVITTDENGNKLIKINPNSPKSGEFILMHEVTHGIETSEMKNLILDYASKHPEFKQALNDLQKTYDTKDVSSEVVADISGQLFGNQEFINSLSTTNPNVFQKIYNKIIEIANKITGNSNEKLFMKDLQNKWEKAYREAKNNQNSNNETQFSIAGIKSIENLKENKRFEKFYKGAMDNYNKAIEMFENKESNEKIRKETKWFQDKNGDWKYEFSDKDFKVKDELDLTKLESKKEYILKDIIDHDMLSNLYPEIMEYKVIFKKMSSKGSFDSETNKIYINEKFLQSNKNKLGMSGMLIHEIQHAIQHYEGFEGGSFSGIKLPIKKSNGQNVKLFGKQYYDSLGEMEASDTKERYYKEKENPNYRKEVAPVSSEANPKHKGYDNYINNISNIEKKSDELYDKAKELDSKLKDSLNDFLKRKSEDYNENIEEDFFEDKTQNNSLKDKGEDIRLSSSRGIGNGTSDSSFSMLPKEIQDYVLNTEEFKDHENEDKTPINKSLEELEEQFNNMGYEDDDFYKIKYQKDAVKNGYNSVYDYVVGQAKDRVVKEYNSDYGKEKYSKILDEINKKNKASEQLQKDIEESTPHKNAQYNIIQETNPAPEGSNYVWIRSPKDIHTWSEIMEDSDLREESFTWGDFTEEDAEKALKTNKITVYSSYAIKNGTFVSSSYQQALEYAGGDASKVHSRTVKTDSVAWINGDEGQYAKVNNKNIKENVIAKDNKGRTLSKEQQNYFKDSKVRDEKGNLQVMYHGTPNGEFTTFRPGSYFSSNQEYATGYQNPSASSISYGKTTTSPKTYEVYLNITNPFTLNDPIAKNIYLKEYIKGGNSAYFDPYTDYTDTINSMDEIDWVEGEDLKEWLQENHPEFDGLYLDEGGDGGYGGADYRWRGISVIPFNSNQIKSVDNTNPTLNDDIRYSKNGTTWQEYLDDRYKPTGTRTNLSDIKQNIPTKADFRPSVPIRGNEANTKTNVNRTLNPLEISQLTPEDANTTPKLPVRNRNRTGDGKSKFWNNINDKTNMLNQEQKNNILANDEVKYYDTVTNKESLDKAYARLNEGGAAETLGWKDKFTRDSNGKMKTQASAVDIAEGWILMKQYADNNQYDEMVSIAKTMRDIGTEAGQTIQAFNIMSRMTPEGMVKYAQSELSEAYDKMVKNKSKQWIEENREKFDLKPDEVNFIMETMDKVKNMEDGYDKKVELAKIQKLMTDKLPPEKGAAIKSWMRISMLFNPKTQVRNVAGNALIAPVNAFGDVFASYADKLISYKTGVRTTGNVNIKATLKGFKDGAYQATNDYKLGINTKDMEGNRFELSDGKSFNEKSMIGKSLNRVEGLLNYVMDAGDRMFSQSSFENSLQNQMELNHTTEITQEMIDIARQESLSRTWNDNNNYTNFVLSVRKMINTIKIPGTNGYGLGDVLIPFAKTPANLTKAIVDYSPAGLVNTLIKGKNLKNSIETGQFTASQQHEFVQSLGKATAGTMLYVAAYALAKAGIASGDGDDDKDVANFIKNTLGINNYSIKIGDKSFTYDWAQPLAAPLSIMTNIVNSENDNLALLEGIVASLDSAGSILLEQSFLSSLNDVLTNSSGVVSGIEQEILELPARAVPTFMKQIADLTDGTQRQTFEKDKPVQSAINSIKAKIPGVSKTLAPSVNTMGEEIQKYGGKNNFFNVFLNPANINSENMGTEAKEIYDVYQETGDATIMPKVAPYSITTKDGKIVLSSEERAEYQKVSGDIIKKSISEMIESSAYNNLSAEDKAQAIKDVIDYSYNMAKTDVLGIETSTKNEAVKKFVESGGKISDYFITENTVSAIKKKGISNSEKKKEIGQYFINSNMSDKDIAKLYSKYYGTESTYNDLITMKIPLRQYIKLDGEEIQSQYNEKNGKTISGSKKNAYIQAVNTLNLSVAQKAYLIRREYSSFKNYDNDIVNYVNNLNIKKIDKELLLKSAGFNNYDKDIVNYINSQNLTPNEKAEKLKDLGFTVRNGRVYY